MQSGEVDMHGPATVTWTSSRNAQWGNLRPDHVLRRAGIHGQRRDLGHLQRMMELTGRQGVRPTQGTTTELNLQDFSNQNNMNLTPW